MARVFELVDSSGSLSTISLVSTTATEALRDGFGNVTLGRAHLEGLDPVEGGKVAESYKLLMRASSHDTAAGQLQALHTMLRKAARYGTDPRQTSPIYLKQQTNSESNARYALVYGCFEFEYPNLFNRIFDSVSWISEFGITIIREHPWRNTAPNTLPTVMTLGATDGPASPTLVHVANFRDTCSLTHVYRYDASGTSYSANLVGTTHDLFPASTAVDDILYIGSTTGPIHNIVIPVGTAGSYVATPIVEIWTGAAWVALTLGTEYTTYPIALAANTFLASTGDWVINVFGKTGWVAYTVNAVSAWWVRVRLNPFTSMATIPACNPAIYAQKNNWIEIPAASLKGDVPETLLIRATHPAGASTTACPGATSRILVGSKSRNIASNEFIPSINAGNQGNTAAWTVTYGTDSSSVTTAPAWHAPQGYYCACSFATDTTLVARATFTGTAMLAKFVGRYRAFILAAQQSGATTNTSVRLRTWISGTSGGQSKFDSQTVTMKAVTPAEWEVVDMGILRLPFAESLDADSLGADLIFQVLASRSTGAATLNIGSIFLLPVDEWSNIWDDPLSDATNGNSALRGLTSLDVDGGVLRLRTAKFLTVSSTRYLSETWIRDGEPPKLEPALLTRLYFLKLYYPSTWGTGPLLAGAGQHLAVQVYGVQRYTTLMGSG